MYSDEQIAQMEPPIYNAKGFNLSCLAIATRRYRHEPSTANLMQEGFKPDAQWLAFQKQYIRGNANTIV